MLFSWVHGANERDHSEYMVLAPPATNPQAWKRCMSLLERCSDVRQLQAAHALLVTHGLHRNTFALSRLILASCSLPPPPSPTPVAPLSYASLLFRHAPTPPNSFIYNTLIRAHSRSSQPRRALAYFLLLRAAPSAAPDHHTFPFVLIACASIPSLPEGTQIHALVFKNGLASSDHFVQTALLRLYEQSIDLARKMFDEIPHRDPVHWDVLMNGYLRQDLPSEALCLFRDMLLSGQEPDAHDITTALAACSHAAALKLGVWIHQYLVKKDPSFLRDTYIGSALVSMYAKCGCIRKAVRVFDSMLERNSYLWSAMIGGLAMHGFAKEAIHCLARMQGEDGVRPDGVVLLGVITACSHAGLVGEGLRLLANMETIYGVVPMHEHYSCAIDMLCRVGRLDEAMELIGQMPMRPLASVWGSLLTGCRIYANVELAELAVEELQRTTVETGDDEGVYVQLSNIYLSANKREDARRVRKLIGSRGIKKTPASSAIEVDGVVNSFVAGDQVHPHRLEIWRILNCLTDHIEGSDRPCREWE